MKRTQRSTNRLKRVVVTGGLGFIGAALCRRLLAEGSVVLVIDNQLFGRRKDVLPPHRSLKVVNIDIRDRKKVMQVVRTFRPDAIFHLAAIAFIPKCMEDPGLAVGVHLDGTLNILAAAEAARVRHFHFASSAAVYSPEFVVLSEDSTPTMPPPDVYGVTKLAGELMCERFQRVTGAHVVITRSFNVYGPHRTNRFLIPSICEQIHEGVKTLRLGNLAVARDYIYVDDAVDVTLLLMRRTSGLVTANVGSGKKTTVKELVRMCVRIAQRDIRVFSDKKFRRPKTTDRPAWQADMRHLNGLIPWKPRYTLKQGLERMILGK